MTKKKRKRRSVSARGQVENRTSGYVSTVFRLPEGVNEFRLVDTKGKRIEIIPYDVTVDHNPLAEKGAYHMERTFYTHRRIGANEDDYVCPRKTWGKPCPICEHLKQMAQDPDADEDLIKSLRPKQRQLFNVVDLANPDDGVQVWHMSFHLFGKGLNESLRTDMEDEDPAGWEMFADPDEGFTLRIGVSEEKIGANKFFEVTNIDFRARKNPIPDAWLDAANNLDNLLIEVPYEKLEAIYHQTEEDTGTSVAVGGTEGVGGNDVDDEEAEEQPAKKSENASRAKGRSTKTKSGTRAKKESGTKPASRSKKKAKTDDEPEAKTAPAMKPKGKAKTKPPEDDDDWDDGFEDDAIPADAMGNAETNDDDWEDVDPPDDDGGTDGENENDPDPDNNDDDWDDDDWD